ncbi:rhodanese-like domain-containing protein [Klebsiella pneumoniae]
MPTYAYRQAAGIRQALLDRRELALIDVREEADFATAHPLFAVNLPLSKLELEVRRRIPRFTTPLTVYDNGEGLAEIAVERLRSWGYQDVALLAEGLAGWRRSGGELFQDVNSASKAFGELVESVRHTPSLSAQEVQALIDSRQEVVIVDARRFDEYQTMSIPGSLSAPGGQLVQETDHFASVRGARIVLLDDDGIRAAITGSWLAQMGWETARLSALSTSQLSERGVPAAEVPPGPQAEEISPAQLAQQLEEPGTVVLDFTTSANFVARHIPGAWWLTRSQLRQALEVIPPAQRYVVTCGSSLLARYAVPEVAALTGKPVQLLTGGTLAWIAAGLPLAHGDSGLAVERRDRYRRPYEGTDNSAQAMQAYLEWEYGLVDQLARDGTHGFRVL